MRRAGRRSMDRCERARRWKARCSALLAARSVRGDGKVVPRFPIGETLRVLRFDDLERPVAKEDAERRIFSVDDLQDRRSGRDWVAARATNRAEDLGELGPYPFVKR